MQVLAIVLIFFDGMMVVANASNAPHIDAEYVVHFDQDNSFERYNILYL